MVLEGQRIAEAELAERGGGPLGVVGVDLGHDAEATPQVFAVNRFRLVLPNVADRRCKDDVTLGGRAPRCDVAHLFKKYFAAVEHKSPCFLVSEINIILRVGDDRNGKALPDGCFLR